MTTPTITLYPDTLPAKGQANAAFDTNVDNFLTWQTVTNGPELNTFITWTVGVRDNVLATALAGDLPTLTGKALNFIRANAAENGGEFRTPAQVLSDIGATAALALKAPLASPALTGNPTATTQTAGNDSTRIATTAFAKNLVDTQALGVGQTWAVYTRSSLTSYQNTTGRTIAIAGRGTTGTNSMTEVSVNGSTWIEIASEGSSEAMNFFSIIPPSWYYRARATNWKELR
jgi:hypothetical protein